MKLLQKKLKAVLITFEYVYCFSVINCFYSLQQNIYQTTFIQRTSCHQ